jgi:hypothetical protein
MAAVCDRWACCGCRLVGSEWLCASTRCDDHAALKILLSRSPALGVVQPDETPVGEWGGHMLVDCDDPVEVLKACLTFPAFVFEARPVIPVEDAVRVELEAISWRDGLKGK